jgi:hypothetical protein
LQEHVPIDVQTPFPEHGREESPGHFNEHVEPFHPEAQAQVPSAKQFPFSHFNPVTGHIVCPFTKNDFKSSKTIFPQNVYSEVIRSIDWPERPSRKVFFYIFFRLILYCEETSCNAGHAGAEVRSCELEDTPGIVNHFSVSPLYFLRCDHAHHPALN